MQRTLRTSLPAVALLASVPLCAEDTIPALNLSLQPQLLKTELVTSDSQELKEAKLNSGLEFALDYGHVELAVDYQLQSHFKADALDSGDLSQLLNATLRSKALDEALGLKAGIQANSTVRRGGDSYRYRVAPGFKKSVPDLADVDFRYEYVLDKSPGATVEKEKRGYVLGLKGALQDGRLTWSSSYRATDESQARQSPVRTTELINFKSRYLVASDMHLEFSSALKHQSVPGAVDAAGYEEKRYGAGIAWSPSENYSLALKVNRLEENRSQGEQFFGSGTFSWMPDPDMEFSVGYGDQLIEGARGLMFNTLLRLDATP